jgi:hypothetical protein
MHKSKNAEILTQKVYGALQKFGKTTLAKLAHHLTLHLAAQFNYPAMIPAFFE